MKTEQRLREVLHRTVDDVQSDPDGWAAIQAQFTRSTRRRRSGAAVLVAAIVIALVAVTMAVVDRDARRGIDVGGSGDHATTPMPPEVLVLRADGLLTTIASTDGHILEGMSPKASTDEPGVIASVSPDGPGLFFTEVVCNQPGCTHIVRIPLVGGPHRPVFGSACCLRSPAVSPDGRWLLYTGTALSDGTGDLLLYDLDANLANGNPIYSRRWSSDAAPKLGIGLVSWSPDGTRIAFQDLDAVDGTKPRVLQADAPESTVLSSLEPVPIPDDVAWQGYVDDRTFLGIEDATRAVLLDAGTGAVQRVLFESPDGTELRRLTVDASGRHFLAITANGLFRWSLGDGKPTRLGDAVLSAQWFAGRPPATSTTTPAPTTASTQPTPTTTTPAADLAALPEFHDDDARFQESVQRLASRKGRPLLGAERVYCDLYAALPDINRLDARYAFEFPLGEDVTEELLVEGCLRSDYLRVQGAVESLRAGLHSLCTSTENLTTADGSGTPKAEVVTPVVVFNATCVARGYPAATPELLVDVNHRRRAEIMMRAVPVDCPTREVTEEWVGRVSEAMLGTRFGVGRTIVQPPLDCFWPDFVDFVLQAAYAG